MLSISPAGSKLFIKSGPTITETVGTVGVNWTPSNTNSLTVQDEIMKVGTIEVNRTPSNTDSLTVQDEIMKL